MSKFIKIYQQYTSVSFISCLKVSPIYIYKVFDFWIQKYVNFYTKVKDDGNINFKERII